MIARRLKKKFLLAASCVALLFLVSGCAKLSRERSSEKQSTMPFANVGQPTIVSSKDADAAEPAVAAAPDGSAFVVWVEHRGKEADVMLKHFNGDGQPIGPSVRVNPQMRQATAWRGDPPTIAIAPDGTVHVGWTARVDSDSAHGTNVYLSASRDQGQSFFAPVKVNDDQKPAAHGLHSLAVAGNGAIYVAWLDERNVLPMPAKDMNMNSRSTGHHMESNRELFFSSSTDGGRSFSPNSRIGTDACPCCKTALAVANDGRLYVSWRRVLPGDYRHIAVSSSPDAGQTFSEPVIVSDDQWILKGCPVSGAALSTGKDGALSVLWYAGGEKDQHGIYWTESRDEGRTFSPRQLIAAGNAQGTPVFVHGANGDIGIWEAEEKGASELIAAPFGNSSRGVAAIIASHGELPAVAASPGRVFIAYVVKDDNRQSIRLISVAKEKLLI
jgi:hypothetical protein